jgi:hypothetical protein
VIAEIGINHDGDMDKARRLIQQSRDAGCKGIKFQYRNIKTAYTSGANEIGDEIILTQINRTFLDAGKILELRNFAKSIGIFFICLISLIMVLLIGSEIKGSKRWLSVSGFSFQPSEIIKCSLCNTKHKEI